MSTRLATSLAPPLVLLLLLVLALPSTAIAKTPAERMCSFAYECGLENSVDSCVEVLGSEDLGDDFADCVIDAGCEELATSIERCMQHVPKMKAAFEDAHAYTASVQLEALERYLLAYAEDHGSQVTNLPQLANPPSGEPYLAKVPLDPWGRSYVLESKGATLSLRCFGADGLPGTDDDITRTVGAQADERREPTQAKPKLKSKMLDAGQHMKPVRVTTKDGPTDDDDE